MTKVECITLEEKTAYLKYLAEKINYSSIRILLNVQEIPTFEKAVEDMIGLFEAILEGKTTPYNPQELDGELEHCPICMTDTLHKGGKCQKCVTTDIVQRLSEAIKESYDKVKDDVEEPLKDECILGVDYEKDSICRKCGSYHN